jgi:hypothetical protein
MHLSTTLRPAVSLSVEVRTPTGASRALVAPLTAPLAALSGQERLYLLPSPVGDLPAPDHGSPSRGRLSYRSRDTTDPAVRQTRSRDTMRMVG